MIKILNKYYHIIILGILVISGFYLYDISHHRGEHKVTDISGIKYHCFVNEKGEEYQIRCYNNMYKKKTFVINLPDNHNLIIHEKNDKVIVLLIYVIFGIRVGLTLYLIDKKMKSVH